MIFISDLYREESRARMLNMIEEIQGDSTMLKKLSKSKKKQDKKKMKEILRGHLRLLEDAKKEADERYEFYKSKLNFWNIFKFW